MVWRCTECDHTADANGMCECDRVKAMPGRVDALEEKVGSLDRRTGSLTGFAVKDVERITALEAKVAALEARKGLEPKAVGLVSEIHRERDAEIVRLRAENANAYSSLEALRKENAELDAKAKDALHRPAPQPIETAPLGQILTWPCDCEDGDGPEWSIEWSFGRSLDEQRAELKKWGRTHWLPMPPPPPGGGK
jgi:chromosome segregation ATPase